MTETREEFAQAYARRSGVTVEWLQAHGREAEFCDCGEDGCEGWQMAYVEKPGYSDAEIEAAELDHHQRM